jgi:NAD-dependent dihydropyrimidine dehydrogenase PreA subunit
MTGEAHFAIARDAHRCSAEPAHGNAGLVQGGHARQQGGAEGGCGGGSQRSAREDRAQRHPLVGLVGHPQAVGVGAPGEDGGQGRMAVLEQALNTRHRARSFGRGNGDLVYDHGLSVLENGLPALARARVYELDQPRFGLTLGHMGAMVTLRDMAYVIVQPCVGVKDASCVEVCPVDCIHTDDAATMYYIDPDECIDCGACVDPCPVDAIFPEDEVPEQWRDFIKINADYFKK